MQGGSWLPKALIIVGAGGHGRVVLDAAEASNGGAIAGFVDESARGLVNGQPILRSDLLSNVDFLHRHRFVVAIGDQSMRRRLSEQIKSTGGDLATIIHPAAWISPHAQIGVGSVVIGGVIVNANARIGEFCILNSGCSVDHDCVLLDGVQVCPGARLAGAVTCGEDAFIGTGATIVPGVTVGPRARIGAGSVVLRDVREETTVVGNPAKMAARGDRSCR